MEAAGQPVWCARESTLAPRAEQTVFVEPHADPVSDRLSSSIRAVVHGPKTLSS